MRRVLSKMECSNNLKLMLHLVAWIMCLGCCCAFSHVRPKVAHYCQSTRWRLGQPWHSVPPSSIESHLSRVHYVVLCASDGKSEGKSDEKDGFMADAFGQLSKMDSLDDETEKKRFDAAKLISEKKKEADQSFAKALDDIDLSGLKDSESISSAKTPPEKELKVYSDMVSEVESQSENEIYSDLISDLGGKPVVGNIPEFDPSKSSEGFMNQALEEALADVQSNASVDVDSSSVLDNKEMRKEIEKIFDAANDKLLQGISEIREEQKGLAKSSLTENSAQAAKKDKENEERLLAAENNMKQMLDRVNEETREVELAIQELKEVQASLDEGTVGALASLKAGGIAKQATLVGAFLFFIRSIGDAVLTIGGDSSHLLPAAVQGAIAVSCLIAFLVL